MAGVVLVGLQLPVFLVTAIGSSVIRMVPPLIVRGVDCDKAVEILSKSINEVAEGK